MIPTSTRDIDRFCPSRSPDAVAAAANAETAGASGSANPVYLIKPASALERRRFRRDLVAAGARYPGNAELFASARAAVTRIAPLNEADLMALLDEAESALDLGEALPGDKLTLAARLDDMLLAGDERFAELKAQREFWLEAAPWVAARHFLVGWENVDIPFARTNGLVADELLEQLPEADVLAIGWRAHALMLPGEKERKNSASPPPSPSGPATSPAAS